MRALQKAATADRLAATWYGTSLTLDVKISDGLAHKVSLYLLDWDARGRSETIQLVDASTGLVLDSRSAAAFSEGQYFTWAVTGRVLIRVNLTGAANAVYSALFFDARGAEQCCGIGACSWAPIRRRAGAGRASTAPRGIPLRMMPPACLRTRR